MLRFVAAFIIDTVAVRHRNIKFDMSSASCGVFFNPERQNKVSFRISVDFVCIIFLSWCQGHNENVPNLQAIWLALDGHHASDLKRGALALPRF